MKIGKETQNTARRLFQLCLDGAALSEDRVRLVARRIAERKPRNYVALLTAFDRLVQYAVRNRTATIHSAIPLTGDEQAAIKTRLEAKYGAGLEYNWAEEPGLIGGIRIQVGDDVTDGSIRSRIDRLACLTNNLSK